MTESRNSVTIPTVGRLVVGYIENEFRKGSWEYGVELKIEKTKPGWFSTQISMRISWYGEKDKVDSFTEAAKSYLVTISDI